MSLEVIVEAQSSQAKESMLQYCVATQTLHESVGQRNYESHSAKAEACDGFAYVCLAQPVANEEIMPSSRVAMLTMANMAKKPIKTHHHHQQPNAAGFWTELARQRLVETNHYRVN
jgi:hypothetical protein